MTTITRAALTDLVAAHHAALILDAQGEDADSTATAQLDALAGEGTPHDDDFAQSLGADYICALDDGTIAAWGGDMSLWAGLSARDLVFIAPTEQVA